MSTKAKFDRSKLKGTALNVIQEQNKEIASSSKKRDYVQIKEGTNKLRVFPAHPESDGELDRYAQKKTVVWLPYKNDDGKISNRSYLNARLHAKQAKDLAEEYHRVAVEQLQSDKSLKTDDKASKLNALSDYKTGIKHQGKYLAYVEDTVGGDRGLTEFSFGVKKKLDAISLAEVEEDPTSADVISDPNDGYGITIKYDKSKPNNDKYSVQLGRKITPVSDESLDWWIEEDSLVDILHTNVNYHQGVIDSVRDGLAIYDKEQKLGVINSDEFLAIFEELRSALPAAPIRDDNGGGTSSSSNTEDEAEEKLLGDMDKSELKQFILDAELDVRVIRSNSVDDVLDMIEVETGLTEENYPSDLSEVSAPETKVEDEEVFEEPVKPARKRGKATTEEVDEVEEKPSRRSRRSRA